MSLSQNKKASNTKMLSKESKMNSTSLNVFTKVHTCFAILNISGSLWA